jgi:plastocyanin
MPDHAARRAGMAMTALLLVAVGALVVGGVAMAVSAANGVPARLGGPVGPMGGTRTAMMGGGRGTAATVPQPGEAGFVPGTAAAPRVVHVVAGPGYAFSPSTIPVARGETVTFEVTSMGGLVHEFMVGPADAVAADAEGTPEVSDIGMMQTASVTYTFDGSGPYAFACHATGHYEAGMRGSIIVAG